MPSHLAPRPFPLLPANVPKRIFLIEDNSADLQRLKEIMFRLSPEIDLVHAAHFADAIERLDGRQFDAVLLGFDSGDSEFLDHLLEHTDAPIIVLTAPENDPVALEALRNGADDYLVKHAVDCDTLRQALQRAVARNVWRRHMYVLSLIDDLTGLYNRRGFMTLGQQQLTIAQRA